MSILGLHHITLVSGDAQRTVDFYTRVLGLRFVKKTVNFDAPTTYHLYFGNETGAPPTAITFFEWPDAPKGHVGIGGTHHLALGTGDYDALLRWKRRLTDRQVNVYGPYERGPFQSIYFRDPDGVRLEIATQGPGWSAETIADRGQDLSAQTWETPVEEIDEGMSLMLGMHHISALSANLERTHRFFGELLGMNVIAQTTNRDNHQQKHWFWGVGEGKPGTLISYFEEDPERTKRAQIGRGQTHHFALAVADEETQLQYREKLASAGLRVTPVIDRVYFKSVYTNDPDGHIVELATMGPGFLVDEPIESLGTRLMLPPWYEAHRDEIEAGLKPISTPAWELARLGRF